MDASGNGLTDVEVALMDAIKTVVDALLVAGVKSEYFLTCFETQRADYLARRSPDAAAVMEMLRAFVDQRSTVRRLLSGAAPEDPPSEPSQT